MKSKKGLFQRTSFAAALLLSATSVVSAQETVTERLSPETRQILVEEMQLLASAMGPLHTAIITGEHHAVAERAHEIYDSFVLKQKLSAAQRKEIGTLPQHFIEADSEFHELAAHLAEAGKQENPALERFYFEEMTRSCQSCHQDFAGGRFPGLVGGTKDTHSH
ncbi:cytochrome c [Thiohalomonas denitrificans]|uniref:Cytochrome C n=1 Tax=Thiohalomonas denitrificans TaxID=415747 RepID=A0A1G5PRT3_9GAMM|nr:cytochrome c [Thiohalomonas denitrificans]SCZ52173.1 Cytochrome C' [Thiohalomonas denitrificans]